MSMSILEGGLLVAEEDIGGMPATSNVADWGVGVGAAPGVRYTTVWCCFGAFPSLGKNKKCRTETASFGLGAQFSG